MSMHEMQLWLALMGRQLEPLAVNESLDRVYSQLFLTLHRTQKRNPVFISLKVRLLVQNLTYHMQNLNDLNIRVFTIPNRNVSFFVKYLIGIYAHL